VDETGAEKFSIKPLANTPPQHGQNTVTTTPAKEAVHVAEEEDDLTVPVEVGTECRRRGCVVRFESDAVNRAEGGVGSTCIYHPKSPIFHEGSKGYLCCKPRVLEFEEFLKIKGCATGRHVFVPKASGSQAVEELTECRIDHYQTPNEVHVSIFAKKADQQKSIVTVEETQLSLDLYLPNSKRFRRTLVLFGPVDTSASSYKFYGTKVRKTRG
jgi:hypothetical protein